MIHLHNHNEYSLLDGVGTGEDYANKAEQLGMKAIALTNHGNVDGCIKFQEACMKKNIHPILGFEAYIVPDLYKKEKGEKRSHLSIIAKNDIGWSNILKMLTVANVDGFYYRPRIDPKLLMKHTDGLILMSACCATFLWKEWGIKLLADLYKKGFKDLFFEIMPLQLKEQIETNKLVKELRQNFKYDVVATNDCHYVNKGDNEAQEVLLAIQSKKKWKDKDRWKFDIDDLYIKSRGEMARSFKRQNCLDRSFYSEAINNTEKVYELVKNFTIEKITVDLPKVSECEGNEDEFLRKLCVEGYNKKVKGKVENEKEYKERLEFEYKSIIKQGFCRYFLIVWELIDWCKKNDILVGPGRGSAGGSLVCYLLNITEVDPVKYNLIFARFISPARIDLPDIDMDFEDKKRHMIRKHLEELYGKDNVCGVSTFSTMKGRGAIRDVSRVFDVPLADVGKAAKSIVVRSGGDFRSDYTIEDAFNTFEDGIEFKKKYPHVVNIAMILEGQVKTKGTHAAAIVISKENLKDGKRCNLQLGKDKNVVTNWDKYDIEHFGLMKLDVLGLNMLTVLNEARKMVKGNHGADIDYYNLPLDDKKCYEEFSKGNNIGCFQVCSLGLRKFCIQLGIDDFGMLVHATSLFRPGTLRSGMTTEFVRRKKGEIKWKTIHPIIKKLTKDTYGIILYQEQVMKFMYELAGLGWRTCDTVRKVISKSKGEEQFQKFKKQFAEGCVKKGTLNKKTAEKLWDELSSFGSYGFNLSHAVEYSLITYWDMWVKVHYPEEFICASLTYGPEDETKKEEMIQEAFRLGINVRMPKVGISDTHNWIIKNNILYCPFIEIKGIGAITANKLKDIKLEDNKEGFFKGKGKISEKFNKILKNINAYEDIDHDDDFAESVEEYFKFSFIKDRSRKFKKIIELLSGAIKLKSIGQAFTEGRDEKKHYFFGYMTEIKYGYRSKVKDVQNKVDTAGVGDNLGGVYGNFKDNSDFCMMVFDSKIYGKKKDYVEHCEEEFVLSYAVTHKKHQSLLCRNAWFEEEIISGNLYDMNLNLAQYRRFSNKDLLKCEECELRGECRKPVLPSKGLYNIMIIGEAPGRDEDKEGYGFAGQSGKLLWNKIRNISGGEFKRKHFTISSIVKCFPFKSKTPSKLHMKKCSKWIKEEIENIKPFLILSFGNTGLKFFLNEDKGIMSKNGTTEWNDKYGCWICWCISPASVLYHRENEDFFERGIENFISKVRGLGGIGK